MADTAVSAFIGICWAVCLLVSVVGIYATWGNAQMVQMFPEGRRWWMPLARLLALIVFAVIVLANPFGVPRP